jgi:hypothetical protein
MNLGLILKIMTKVVEIIAGIVNLGKYVRRFIKFIYNAVRGLMEPPITIELTDQDLWSMDCKYLRNLAKLLYYATWKGSGSAYLTLDYVDRIAQARGCQIWS